MRPALLLALLLGLAACVPPDDSESDLLPDPIETPDASEFEVGQWLQETAALDTLSDLDERDARSRELAAQLDAVTSWTQECDIDEPSGQLYLHDLSDERFVVEAVCFRAAYQATSVLVGLEGETVRLLRLPIFDETGVPSTPDATTYDGYVSTEGTESGTFDLISLGQSEADCGVRARYRLAAQQVEAVRVQARTCETPCPDGDCTDSASWPPVYPSPTS